MQIRKSILILIIIAACLAFYLNTLFADFVWDDDLFILKNPYIKSFKFLPGFFKQDFCSIYIKGIISPYYRPFLAVSFMMDYALWKDNPFGYHLSNLIFHILASILLFLLVEALSKKRLIAFVSSVLFSVHPIHTEAVSFISGRVDSIPLIFYLLALLFFFRHASSRSILFYSFSLICFAIALFTKEMAITLPFIVICIDYIFLSRLAIKNVIKNFMSFHFGFFFVLGLYLFIRSYSVGLMNTIDSTIYINFISGTASYWRLFTVIKIIAYYLGLLFIPFDLRVMHLFSAANSLLESMVFTGIVVILILLLIAIRSLKNNTFLSFSILWFFITLLPVSNIIPQGNIFAERYMYIPSVGFCMGMGFLFWRFFNIEATKRTLNWKIAILFIFFLVVVISGKTTYERNKKWHDNFTLWHDAAKHAPYVSKAHINLALAYFKLGHLDKAIEEADTAIRLDPHDPDYFHVAGALYSKKGLTDKAINSLNKAIELSPNSAEIYHSLAVAYGMQGQYDKAIDADIYALENNPQLYDAYYNLALNYKKLGLINEAISAYEAYLKQNPQYAGVHVDLGYLYYQKGDFRNAESHWFLASKLTPDYQPAKDALRLLKE